MTAYDRRLRPVDSLTVVYLGLMLVPLLVLARSSSQALVLAAAHIAGIAVLVVARRLGLHRTRIGEWILAFYPILLFAFLYTEVGSLIQIFHSGVMHDAAIQRAEGLLFGGQPSQELSQRFPSRLLGEYLHLGYTSYYLLAPLLFGTLWFTRSRRAFDLAIATVSLSFYVSFVIFVLYPVAGPYQSLPHLPAEGVGILIPRLTRYILDRGSSVGAAFPSSHVAVSVAVWIMAMRFHRGLAVVLAFLVPALALGSIYGGYHYATDALAGAILGILVGTLGYGILARFWNEDQVVVEEAVPKARSRSTPASTDSSA